jgi:ATP-dependent Clp protease protease subunit
VFLPLGEIFSQNGACRGLFLSFWSKGRWENGRLTFIRDFYGSGPIDDISASVITAQLLFLESEAPKKPLYMYINTAGGSVTAGLAIYDTMQYINPAVHTIATGQAASIGALLLCGGDVRMALPHAEIMLQQPSGGAQGMASNILIQSREILRLRSSLNKLYAKHTGQSIETIEQVMDRNTYMDCSKAKDFGIIDTILEKRDLTSAIPNAK